MADIFEILGVPTSPPTGGTVPSSGLMVGSPDSEEGTLSKVLGYLERPSLALGELVGELTSDDPGDLLEAMKRGMYGEGEHGTIGEQLIPDSPDDPWEDQVVKDVARFGVDVVADPINLLGALPARAGIGAASRAASKVLKKVPVPQVLARWAIPMTHVFERWGGAAGRRVSVGLKRAYKNHKLTAGAIEFELMDQLAKLGLTSQSSIPYRKAAYDLLRGVDDGTSYHRHEKTRKLADWLWSKLDGVADPVEGYKDPDGKVFRVIEPMLADAKDVVYKKSRTVRGALAKNQGEWREQIWKAYAEGGELPTKGRKEAQKVLNIIKSELDPLGFTPTKGGKSIWKRGFQTQPWKRRDFYAPQMLNQKTLEMFYGKPSKGYHKVVRQFAKELGVGNEKALSILRNMAMPKRAGNIEYARYLPFSEDMFEKDPLLWFPKYMSRLQERIAYADEFGLNGQRLDSMYETMKGDPGSTIDKKWLRDAHDIILGKNQTDRSISDLAQKVMGAQVATKMGFLSTLSNLSQNANTIIKEGGTNFLKGVFRSMTDQGRRQGYIAYQKSIEDALKALAGGKSNFAQWYLNATQFNRVERMNRLFAANAGIVRAEQVIRQEGKLTRDLIHRGLDEADVLATLKNGGKLPTEIADKVGFLASEATQHATHWKDLPLGWQDPFMRIATQYKNFVYQQSRFLLREVLKPAKEYFESNGKKGSIAPLTRAFVTFGISAELVGQARSEIRGWGADLPKLWGADPLEHKPRERRDDYVIQLLEDGLNVGALGIAGDLVDRAAYKDLSSWLLGPTFGDVLDFGEEAVSAANRARKGKDIQYEKYMAQLMRRMPFAPGVAPTPKSLEAPASEILNILGVR